MLYKSYQHNRPYAHGLCGWSVQIKPRKQSELSLSSRGFYTCSVDSSAWSMPDLLPPIYSVSFCVCGFCAVSWSGLLSVSFCVCLLCGFVEWVIVCIILSFARLHGVGYCLYHSVSFVRLPGVGCSLYHSVFVFCAASWSGLLSVSFCVCLLCGFLEWVVVCIILCLSSVRLHEVGCCLYHSVSVSFVRLHEVGCCLYHSVSVFCAAS